VWRSVYGYVGGRRELADDVVAEAFSRALHYRSRIRDGAA
jgi:DNA-directed RNA polymerase specialized sigma24 family protein